VQRNGQLWVVILAAGEGNRVKDLTHDRRGRCAPKQYSVIDGRSTLLEATLERAKKIAPPERIVAVVARQHRRWWGTELTDLPARNIIVQPENRGTAAGVLLPVLWVTAHDPDARLVILPSDHGVASEAILHDAITGAAACAPGSDSELVLLGVKPVKPETDYGWIVPGSAHSGRLRRVSCFHEKPDPAAASALIAEGGLLNSFIVAAGGRFLLDRFESALPQLWRRFQPTPCGDENGFWTDTELSRLYRSVPSLDFSKDLLERRTDGLWVYPMPDCGWLDLGTPERLAGHLITHGQRVRRRRASDIDPSPARIPRARFGAADATTPGCNMTTNAVG
jgi:mannose-1-phosphate guanylyltransferase